MTDEAMNELKSRHDRCVIGFGRRAACQVYMDQATRRAVEWFERAAEARRPARRRASAVYELARRSAQGEGARGAGGAARTASEAGEYRDLAQRLEHLMVASRVEAIALHGVLLEVGLLLVPGAVVRVLERTISSGCIHRCSDLAQQLRARRCVRWDRELLMDSRLVRAVDGAPLCETMA